MKDAEEVGVSVSKETSEKFRELKTAWSDFNRLNQERQETKEASGKIAAIGGMLMLLNPIIGLTMMFLAKVANDIRQSEIKAQKKQLLARVVSIRSEISQLQNQKAQLKIEKQERLQEYLEAKQMLKEYNEGLRTIDNNLRAIKEDIQKNDSIEKIREYTKSVSAQNLLNRINGAFGTFEGHEHLVSGPLVQTEKGMRWELYSDGYTDGEKYTILMNRHPWGMVNVMWILVTTNRAI